MWDKKHVYQQDRVVMCCLLYFRVVVVVQQGDASMESLHFCLHKHDGMVQEHALLTFHPSCVGRFRLTRISIIPAEAAIGCIHMDAQGSRMLIYSGRL